MIDRKKFDKLVKEYQNYFTNHKGENGESYWEEEEFKWLGIKTFQDNWDLDAQDLSDMIKRSLHGVSHMMVSQARFPEGMIEDFAEREPDTVRAMFKDLFDESKDIVERFHSFKQKSADLLERVGNGAKNHFQDERTIALYLWLRYPDKYYVYQYTQARNLSIALGSDHRIIKGRLDSNIREWLALYNEVTELMKQKPEVRNWETQGMTAVHYPDPEYRMLATDLAYCYTERILKEQKAEQEWEPKDYNPGITVENWVSLLANNEVYHESAKTVIERLLDYGGQATCTQLAQKYGDNANTYNVNSIAFAKKVYEKTHCKLAEREDESVRWWSILYMGKKADKDDDGVYIWKLRPELAEALKIVNGEEVPDEDTDTTEYTKKDFLEEVFISEAKYDEMYAVLMRKQNIILQGAPGVGKTFAAKRLAYSIMGAKNDDHMLIGICQLVLNGMLQTEDDGSYKLAAFEDSQEMSHLYEKFLLEYYRREHPQLKASASQIRWALDDGVQNALPIMQSDIMLQQGNSVLIIDAKFYAHNMQEQYNKRTIHSGNMYQIYTYVKNKEFELEKSGEPHKVSGMLLYAKTVDVIQPDSVFQMHGNQISVRTLDLYQPFEQIKQSLDGIAADHFEK